jgi:transcriptional regulator with XRE-family HTH domain
LKLYFNKALSKFDRKVEFSPIGNCKFYVYICEMEVKNRIEEILEKSGLTPSEFADKIDVQRSAISHITSGRNKPSLEFLIKIKTAFPEIDTDWLIFGIEKEEISEEILVETETIENSEAFHPTLFDGMEEEEKEENIEIREPTEKMDSKTSMEKEFHSKKIRKVLFFYTDGTFQEFEPSENQTD